MRPDFTKIDYKPASNGTPVPQTEEWLSLEHIPVKSFYTPEDLVGLEHLDYAAGIAPFLRGPYSTM